MEEATGFLLPRPSRVIPEGLLGIRMTLPRAHPFPEARGFVKRG